MVIREFDREGLRRRVREAKPFPHFCIDGFLEDGFAEEALAAFPSFSRAGELGKMFATVNEKNKVQITDSSKFPPAILRLHEALASPQWLETLSYVMDIPRLLADPEMVGGGIHETGPRGHLDVHVDFNYIEARELHRRINILIYFNKDWREEWGGKIELGDTEVKVCHHSFLPVFNRCVVFETSDISYHGVTAVMCPEGVSRKSFAGYYYTKEAPAHWDGQARSTVFRARPDEKLKGTVLMPAEKLAKSMKVKINEIKKKVKGG